MAPPTATEERICPQGIRYQHKGLPISKNCFRKGDTLPHCYLFHKTCNDCRSAGGRIAKAYALPRNVPPSSYELHQPGMQHLTFTEQQYINLFRYPKRGFHNSIISK